MSIQEELNYQQMPVYTAKEYDEMKARAEGRGGTAMSDEPKLLPCPYCGGAPTWWKSKTKHCQLHGDAYQDDILGCRKPRCRVQPSISMTIREHAIDVWNYRPTVPAYPPWSVMMRGENLGSEGLVIEQQAQKTKTGITGHDGHGHRGRQYDCPF